MTVPLMIDGGSTTGWALWSPGLAKPRAGLVQMPDTAKIGRFCNAFAEWMVPFAQFAGVTEVRVEAPIISDHGGSGVNIHEVDKLFGIVHAVEMAADRLEIPCERIARGTVCKHFIGTGRGTRKQLKTGCLLACQRKGWNVTSEDMADALAMLDWYCHEYKLQVPWDCKPGLPLFEGLPGTRITKENQVAGAKLLNKVLSFSAPDKPTEVA